MKAKYIFHLFFTVLTSVCFGQLADAIGPLHSNSAQMYNQISSNQKVIIDSIKLPFVEDFSDYYYSSKPNPKKFTDQNVYINNELADIPPSIGFATFDGLDATGKPYLSSSNSSSGASIVSDFLTSQAFAWGTNKPVPSDSIYLSFYYKAKGLGFDSPDKRDSLILEFKTVSTGIWKKIWSREGYTVPKSDSLFKLVMIPIKDTAYLKKGFQFRFKNKGNGTGVLDLWHVDYIFINKGRFASDVSPFLDVAFKSKAFKMFKKYHAIPFQQYVGAVDMTTRFDNKYRNLKRSASGSSSSIRIDSFNYSIKGVVNFASINKFGCDIDEFDVTCKKVAADTFTYVFPTAAINNNGRKCFDFRHYIAVSSSNDPNFKNYKQNDTMYQKICFNDYFALDDGSAEQAYFLNIDNTALLGRFDINKNDTLRGVDLFFLPVLNNTPTINNKFKIIVYSESGGLPSQELYKDEFMQPIFTNGYGKYERYILKTKQGLGAGTYFIGFEQRDDSLQIGFDVNTNNKSSFFYRQNGTWNTISYEGTPMIRPAFGDVSVGISTLQIEKKDWKVFPNPAHQTLTIQHGFYGTEFNTAFTYEIFNVLGQSVMKENFKNNNKNIDVNPLKDGIYFMKILNADQIVQQTLKLQIKH